jgi:anion-transporting  ArsA/GET3 family ATPase
MRSAGDPSSLVRSRRIVVCVGTGGVGKTTIAAALALEAARRGRRTLVLTIDPARRLADALGVAELGDEPQELPQELRERLDMPPEAKLHAMMLDMKRTFDALVERFADTPETRERILENRIYQHVSDALAGSAEYAAMEKVYEMAESGRFDLIVLDTPPSQHALDFLDAPQRLMEFLDSRIVQILLHPAFAAGRFGFRLFQRTSQRVLQLIERVSGVGFLEEISEFLLAFEGMSEGFRERAHRVRSLLLGPETGFLLVAGPTREAARNAGSFLDHLEEQAVPLEGVVVNRVRVWPDAGGPPAALLDGRDLEADCARLAAALGREGGARAEEAARAAVEAARGYASLVALDRENTASLSERTARAGRFVRRVPELSEDVHDLGGLLQIAGHLLDADAGAAAPAAGARSAKARA